MRSVSSGTHAPSRAVPSASSACPVLFLERQQGLSHTCVDRMADRVLDVRLCKAGDKAAGCPGRVGPHEDVMSDEARVVTGLVAQVVVLREDGDRLVQQFEMVVSVIRAGVARTQHRPERLSSRVAPRSKGMKAKAHSYVDSLLVTATSCSLPADPDRRGCCCSDPLRSRTLILPRQCEGDLLCWSRRIRSVSLSVR